MTNTRELRYASGDTECIGLLALPEQINTPIPVVLIAHTWAGRNDFVDQAAIAISKKGYIGFAVDIYGDQRIGTTTEDCASLMQPYVDNRQLLQQRMLDALQAVAQVEAADQNKVAAMGYCFGGLCVQDLARVSPDVKGIISIHGLMAVPDASLVDKPHWQSKVLLLHGAKDPMVSDEDWLYLRAEMDAANCDWQKHDFGQAYHAFTNPQANDLNFGTVYHPLADKRCTQYLDMFLSEVFETD
ncbi:dienelactone hydrolase family protein [Marinicella sp. W31]|uniref:dienelactone hydrolase family protein n=1 Tax=Marinicella sp. W31 TaxID=3023713 RepID=UPI0037565404